MEKEGVVASFYELNAGRMAVSKWGFSPAADSLDRRLLSGTVDHPFVIHLWEDRTRGELRIPLYGPKELALLGDEILRITTNSAVGNGQRIFEFKAVAPGTHRLVFEKRMERKFTAEDRRVFQIEAVGVSRS